MKTEMGLGKECLHSSVSGAEESETCFIGQREKKREREKEKESCSERMELGKVETGDWTKGPPEMSETSKYGQFQMSERTWREMCLSILHQDSTSQKNVHLWPFLFYILSRHNKKNKSVLLEFYVIDYQKAVHNYDVEGK